MSQVIEDGEFMEARTEEVTEPVTEGLDKLVESVASAFASSRFKSLAANRSISLASRRNPSAIADRIARDLSLEVSQKQELLELLDPAKRLERLLGHFPDRPVHNYSVSIFPDRSVHNDSFSARGSLEGIEVEATR